MNLKARSTKFKSTLSVSGYATGGPVGPTGVRRTSVEVVTNVQVQSDSFLMPIADAMLKWPEDQSPYLPWRACGCRPSASPPLSSSRSRTSCATTHGTAGPNTGRWANSNRAQKQMYWELARRRQAMNHVEHIEPTGEEQFPA
jgi:hypothetical protein